MSVAAIILAAGASQRLGQPKQLVLAGAETLLARCVRIAREAGAEPVIAVLGAQRAAVEISVRGSGALLVDNPQWQTGLSSSIRAGMDALASNAPLTAGALLMNCDQPQLDTPHLRALIAAFEAEGSESIVASLYADTHGVPAIFPARLFGELVALKGDKGARALFSSHAATLAAVPFPGGEIDIDTPEDLARLR